MVTMTHHLLGRGSRRDGRGQGLVEFALVFPLIVLILFGIFDLGRAVYAYNTLANAARQGARVAAVNQLYPPDTNTSCAEDMPVEDTTLSSTTPHWSIRACAASSSISLGVQPSAVTVAYSPPPNTTLTCSTDNSALNVGCIASVTVTYVWTASTPVIGNIVGPITLKATSQIPIERTLP
jgi:Flp pilus assembly protein TadG